MKRNLRMTVLRNTDMGPPSQALAFGLAHFRDQKPNRPISLGVFQDGDCLFVVAEYTFTRKNGSGVEDSRVLTAFYCLTDECFYDRPDRETEGFLK